MTHANIPIPVPYFLVLCQNKIYLHWVSFGYIIEAQFEVIL